jgi:hypothetical protein
LSATRALSTLSALLWFAKKNTFHFIVFAIPLVLIKKNPESGSPTNTVRHPFKASVQALRQRMQAEPMADESQSMGE